MAIIKFIILLVLVFGIYSSEVVGFRGIGIGKFFPTPTGPIIGGVPAPLRPIPGPRRRPQPNSPAKCRYSYTHSICNSSEKCCGGTWCSNNMNCCYKAVCTHLPC